MGLELLEESKISVSTARDDMTDLEFLLRLGEFDEYERGSTRFPSKKSVGISSDELRLLFLESLFR